MPEQHSFVNQFIDALIQAKDYAHQQKRNQWEEEDRGIHKDLLAHQLRDLKIQDRIRARNAAVANLEALTGQSENDYPQQATDADLTKMTPGLPGVVPKEGMVPHQVPTIDIPGIPELGVNGVSRKPDTMEEILAQNLEDLKQKAMFTPRNVARGGKLVIPGLAGNQGVGEDGVVAEGDDYPDRLYNYENYDANTGKTTVEHLTADEIRNRPPATKRPPSSGGSGGDHLSDQDRQDAVAGFADGSLPIDMVPKSLEGVRILSGLKRSGVNVTKATADIKAFRAHLNSLNTGQRGQYLDASDAALTALDRLDEIVAKEKDPSIWTTGSKPSADLQMAAKSFVEALATLRSGGSAALDKQLETAANEFSTGLFSGKLGPKLKRVREAIGYRVASIKGSFVGTGDVAPAPLPTVTGGKGAVNQDPLGLDKK